MQRGEAGRPKTNNYDEVIETLRKRYPVGMPFSKIIEIIQANPDLKGILKTMQKNANALYGMSLKAYFMLLFPNDRNHNRDCNLSV